MGTGRHGPAQRKAGSVTSSEPIIDTSGLVKQYGGIAALQGVDFSVDRGELHCIIGPNGAGKSTFFKLLMGIERPTAGAIRYKGRDVTSLSSFERARLGFSVKFQNIRVYPDLSVFHNLFIPLRRHHRMKEIPAQVAQLLGELRLSGTESETVSNLSHGQIQWLAIGMSIAAEPEILLLDEPTAGMSDDETRETAEIIRRLSATGMTILVIEHDMAFIRDLDTRTTVLHYGRLFAQGTFSEIEANDDVHQIYLGTL
ncbi:MAG: ABC transporter ATP-binding protein [Alphaproteobacteria bacterium]|nr:ABC transporter ATP-binding protein [Alphaproteobacteria bacterium]